jgi:hypothetical protein
MDRCLEICHLRVRNNRFIQILPLSLSNLAFDLFIMKGDPIKYWAYLQKMRVHRRAEKDYYPIRWQIVHFSLTGFTA